MQIETFRRIVTTFSDPNSEILWEKTRTVIQVDNNLIEITIGSKDGEIEVTENDRTQPGNVWILERLAKLPLLADRLLTMVPSVQAFISPEADVRPTLEIKPDETVTTTGDAVTELSTLIDNRSHWETTVLYLTSDAGEGKTSLINELARRQASRYKRKEVDWLLVPIALGGRPFLRFDDIVVGALANKYRFTFFYYDAFLELVRLGVLVPAFDGFEEMFVEQSSGEALSAMGSLVSSLHSTGTILVAARKAYYEFQNLKLQARMYDTIKGNDVGFAKVDLHRWSQPQFIKYCTARKLPNPQELYSRVSERLARADHPLLTRPVLVRRLVDIAEKSATLDNLLEALRESGANYFSVFVRSIVDREAIEKWIDRKGEPATSLLTTEEHCELLAQIALEMWESKVDFIKPDALEFVTDVFAESKRKSSSISGQIRERIKTHALLISSSAASGALQFDHDDFREYFLGEAISKIFISNPKGRRSSLLNILRRGTLPNNTVQSLVASVKRNGEVTRIDVSTVFSDIASLDGVTSYTHENATNLLLNLLNTTDGKNVVLHGLSFASNSLQGLALSNVTFNDCYFAPCSLSGAALSRCMFHQCQFTRIEYAEDTKIDEVAMQDCSVEALHVNNRNVTYFDPDAVTSVLEEQGFQVIHNGVEVEGVSTEPTKLEEAVEQMEKILRYFSRSTHISESVIRMKLGGRSHAFLDEYLPEMQKHGIINEIQNRGGPTQRRFKLGKSMSALNEAIERCDGTIDSFINLATQLGNDEDE